MYQAGENLWGIGSGVVLAATGAWAGGHRWGLGLRWYTAGDWSLNWRVYARVGSGVGYWERMGLELVDMWVVWVMGGILGATGA